MLSGKLRQAVRRATDREVGGYLILRYVCTNTGRSVADILREKRPDMCVPPMENPTCMDFKECKELPETVPLDLLEDDVKWVASKISGDAGALEAEAIEMRNWLLCFRFPSEGSESSFPIWTTGWINPPPLGSYRALMECHLVALDKHLGVRPVDIGESLRQIIIP